MSEYAKELYLQIMNLIKLKEKNLKENQEIRVTLLQYPCLEVTQIGRLGSEFLFFCGETPESPETTLLLPATPLPIRIDVVDSKDSQSAKSKKTIGFCEDIS